jgi:cation transport regulator
MRNIVLDSSSQVRGIVTPERGNNAMPYASNADLPPSVQRHLPEHAQDIYREAFNHAYAAHAGDQRQEEAAHRIAWAAVKRSYVNLGENWVARADLT